jgi:hypothetical protein
MRGEEIMKGYWLQKENGNREWIDMEETTMQTIEQFIEEHDLSMDVGHSNANPNMPDSDPGMHHYVVTIRRGEEDEPRLDTFFSMGSALTGPPELADVLDCLASDASMYDDSQDLLDFAYEMGYTDLKDYPKVERIYNTIEQQRNDLEQLLGTDGCEQLLYETERM